MSSHLLAAVLHDAAPEASPMSDIDRDRPDDSTEPRHKPDSLREEVSSIGQRVKGAAKEVAGDVADDRGLEEKGERENEAGRIRQGENDGV
jgi:uncharacterized protein YjbJ (UPF0337 family)